MTDSRAHILDRLRASRADPLPEPELPVRRFDWNRAERVERFCRMLEAVRAEVHPVGDDWPAFLAERLSETGVRQMRFGPRGPLAAELVAGWPAEGPALVPHDSPIEDCRNGLFGDTDAGFTSCLGGIAETGSLALWPTREEPRLLSLVPPVHAVLIEAERIVSTLHELMVAEGWGHPMPTNALLVSGPSKSADIEQTLAYGVHGPARLMVLVRGA